MKTATIRSRVLVGLEARDVTITASVSTRANLLRAMRAFGVQNLAILGLPSEAAKREARVRVLSALETLGVRPEGVGVTIDPPAPPGSSHLDLPIAVAVLAALGEIPDEPDLPLFGELGLDGSVRPMRGVLPLLEDCRGEVVVPWSNSKEAALSGASILSAAHLSDVLDYGYGETSATDFVPGAHGDAWEQLRTTPAVRRALEVAAAGGHSVLLVGPPGSGKTLIARALHSILPPLSRDEAVEVTKVHSVAGLVDPEIGYVPERPFRAPHHTVSEAGLVGGGAGAPRPGEASLAHRGVLFLDELPEFRAGALELLRLVLRDGRMCFSGRGGTGTCFPAKPMLVASVNPCPCGYRGHSSRECRCTPERVRAYWDRMKPWLDLFDVRIDVPTLTVDNLVEQAAIDCFGASPILRPVEDPRPRIVYARVWDDHGGLTREAEHLDAPEKSLRIARTIADLEGSRYVETQHVSEARELCGVRS